MPLAGGVCSSEWIEQHLRVERPSFGTNENAVKTQIWIAISVYVLVAIVKKHLGVAASLYTILQILSLTLFEKTPLDQLLNDAALQNLNSVRFQPIEFLQLIAGQQCLRGSCKPSRSMQASDG